MNSFICRGTAIFLLSLVVQNNAAAQSVDAEAEESSTAILDTSIPFAIGAREGEQTIRSSFGWPTFQEGFVEGVYFRFDPDGYARFSASPGWMKRCLKSYAKMRLQFVWRKKMVWRLD